MKNVPGGLGVKNMSDLILKEMYGIYETKNLMKEQTKKYKMNERGIFENFDKFSENELNAKSNKNVNAGNDVMRTVIKHCRDEKNEAKEK